MVLCETDSVLRHSQVAVEFYLSMGVITLYLTSPSEGGRGRREGVLTSGVFWFADGVQ